MFNRRIATAVIGVLGLMCLVMPDLYSQDTARNVKCYVSGDEFALTAQTEKTDYKGLTFFFCKAGEKDEFNKAPDKYLKMMSDDHQYYLGAFMAAYLEMQKRLASDTISGIQPYANAVVMNSDILSKLDPTMDKEKLDDFKSLSANLKKAAAEFAAEQFTCPMHPDMIRASAGSCPICGMKLDKKPASIESARKRFKPFSEATISFSKVFLADPSKYSLFYCGMAGGYWMQGTKDIANPYYGASMLKCGDLVKWDEPLKKVGDDKHKDDGHKDGEHKDDGGMKHGGGGCCD